MGWNCLRQQQDEEFLRITCRRLARALDELVLTTEKYEFLFMLKMPMENQKYQVFVIHENLVARFVALS